jgi:hypothetical protein
MLLAATCCRGFGVIVVVWRIPYFRWETAGTGSCQQPYPDFDQF